MMDNELENIVRSFIEREWDGMVEVKLSLSTSVMGRDRFHRVGWQTKWLSTDPDSPGSIGWDAVSCNAMP